MAFFLAILLQFIFVYPKLSIYIPQTEMLSLIFLIAFTLLSSFSITMSIYIYRRCNASLVKRSGSGLLGTIIGVTATACTCSFVVAPLILAGGSIATTIVAFIAAYLIPLRIISLALLVFSLYFVIRNFDKTCNYQ